MGTLEDITAQLDFSDGYGTDQPVPGQYPLEEAGESRREQPPHAKQGTMKMRMALNEPGKPSEHLCEPSMKTANRGKTTRE